MNCIRAIVLCFVALGLPELALAGAWMQPEGHGQAIVTGTFTKSDRGFAGDGETVDIPDYNKFEFNSHLEYGIRNGITAIVQPQLRSVSIGTPTNADHVGLGHTDLGARMRIWSNDNSIFSGQALVRIPGSTDENDPAQTGGTDFETDIRGLYGRSFEIGTWPSFLDAQLGYRIRSGKPSDEIRADITLGTRPVPEILLLAQSFNIFTTGTARGVFSDGREHKLQMSVVFDVADNWSLQIGGITTVAGEESLRERGVVVGLWRRF